MSEPSAVLDSLSPVLEQVESAMREALRSDGALAPLIGEHVLGSGGKRLRPALVTLSAALCGYTGPRRVQVGAAVELLHTATLLHDDVVDLAQLRRGRASANAVWGNRRAVLVGDFLYARASSMIVDDGDLDILEIFSNTIRLMAEGELLQLERSFDPTVTEAHYYSVIDRKSAELLSAACDAGAILAGVTRAERRRLAEFGRQVGLAFQLRDDALDYSAEAKALGKLPCADLEEAAALIKTAGRRAATLAAEGISDPTQVLSDADLAPVVDIVRRHRGIEDTDRRAQEHVARSEAALAPFPDGPERRALLEAAQFVVSRAH
jgi:octaprenyl-diphosphate synthase